MHPVLVNSHVYTPTLTPQPVILSPKGMKCTLVDLEVVWLTHLPDLLSTISIDR